MHSPSNMLLVVQLSHVENKASYSKSVCSFSSARGWKVSALFFMPSTQAESGVLAKIRPKGHAGSETVQLTRHQETEYY